MQRRIVLLVAGVAFVYAIAGIFRSPRLATPEGGTPDAPNFDLSGLVGLPVQTGGRVKPLDSVARNSLMVMRGRTSIKVTEGPLAGRKIEAPEWILEMSTRPEVADSLPVFRIDNPDILGMFDWKQDRKYFSFNDLQPKFAAIAERRATVPENSHERSSFERALVKLADALNLYHGIVYSFHPPDNSRQVREEYATYLATLGPGMREIRESRDPSDGTALGESGNRLISLVARYQRIAESSFIGIQPPYDEDIRTGHWLTLGEGLLAVPSIGEIPPAILGYADLTAAWQNGDASAFNEAVAGLRAATLGADDALAATVHREVLFNRSDVFYKGTILYIFTVILVLAYWLLNGETLRRCAVTLLAVGFAVHTVGIIARIAIQGYAPITNLYSSAVFVAWGTVGLGLIIERVFRNGIAASAAGIVGFLSLIIAHHLSKSGDTMEMMRAVLDDNFWLATHVTVVTLGYVGTFLAGFIAFVYLVRGIFTPGVTRKDARTASTMVYAVVCFAILFSFVGTMLGGIWADQSWGRFWGWDPKENGALLVVLWNAVILHARWGGLVGVRGLMVLAVGGNIVTAWSWFGTNMLGVGLHSYGAIDQAFFWLSVFMISQLIVMILAATPARLWRSPKAA